jgi:hypothetical protein
MCTDISEDPSAIFLEVVNFWPGVYASNLELQLVTLDFATFMLIIHCFFRLKDYQDIYSSNELSLTLRL